MSQELQAIEAALREPFPPALIKFKPKQPRQNPTTKRWECLALPYADKRVYEDRLNQLAFGAWSTPYTPPLVAGNKLVVPVTLVLFGVAHTDFGEAFLASTTRKGETREEENSATEAYSQAFRRACSQFGLGRYLYQLPKIWLPYDPASRVRPIAISDGERSAWVEKLYVEAGLLPSQQHPHTVPSTAQEQPSPVAVASPSAYQPPVPSEQQKTASPATKDVIDATLLAYLRKALHPEQIKRACHYYHVTDLAHLTAAQALHLSDYIEQQKPAAADRS
jgi:hypothetical protein